MADIPIDRFALSGTFVRSEYQLSADIHSDKAGTKYPDKLPLYLARPFFLLFQPLLVMHSCGDQQSTIVKFINMLPTFLLKTVIFHTLLVSLQIMLQSYCTNRCRFMHWLKLKCEPLHACCRVSTREWSCTTWPGSETAAGGRNSCSQQLLTGELGRNSCSQQLWTGELYSNSCSQQL